MACMTVSTCKCIDLSILYCIKADAAAMTEEGVNMPEKPSHAALLPQLTLAFS